MVNGVQEKTIVSNASFHLRWRCNCRNNMTIHLRGSHVLLVNKVVQDVKLEHKRYEKNVINHLEKVYGKNNKFELSGPDYRTEKLVQDHWPIQSGILNTSCKNWQINKQPAHHSCSNKEKSARKHHRFMLLLKS